jgi:hypothetical protein
MTARQHKYRVIAVEERFLTESYLAETAFLRVPADEEPSARSCPICQGMQCCGIALRTWTPV